MSAPAFFIGRGGESEFVDMPADIREKYQYFTEADMGKLRKAGYTEEFIPVEQGVEEYVKNFLEPKKYY